MLRFQQGDESAFEDLVHRNTPRVHGLVFRFLRDASMVEDLTQEVFLRIYRTADRYVPKARFSTWLYRIVANLSFNVLRSRKHARTMRLEISDGGDGETFFADVTDQKTEAPDAGLNRAELRAHLNEAIEKLPENQKVAIILNKYEQKSYEEISEVLDCTTMAVKSLLSRARQNLRETLRRYVDPQGYQE